MHLRGSEADRENLTARLAGLAFVATLALAACSGAPPSPVARAKPAKPAASVAAPATEPTVPPPPLFRFGSFPEDEDVQLFALRGTPLLRVGARIYSLRADEAKREPRLERVLFDAAGKPWWHVLAGTFPGELYADRGVPGASPSDWPGTEVVRIAEGAPRVLGALKKTSGIAQRLVPLPDGRVLVSSQQGDDILSEIVPAVAGDEELLQPCAFYGEGARFADGTVVLPCSDRRGRGETLITFRRGAAPTIEPLVGIEESSIELFSSPGGALYASPRWGSGIYARREAGWVKVERGAAGSEAEALRLHLERARPGGHVRVRLDLKQRHLEVPAFGFAQDPEGGVWALAESGLGLFHDRAPERIVELAPPRKPVDPIPTNLPAPATASDAAPDAPLVEVLDATRYLGEDEGSLRIHPLVGRTFVSIDDQLLYIDGDTLKSDPALQRGLGDRPSAWGKEVIGSVGGRFPESAWLPITYLYDRGMSVKLLRWSATGWTETFSDSAGGRAERVQPLAHGWSILESLQVGFAYRLGPGLALALVHDDATRNVVGGGLVGLGAYGEPRAVATLPDGTLYVAFADAVAAWSPEGMPLPVAPLAPGMAPYGIVVRSSTEIYLLLHPAKSAPEGTGPSEIVEASVAEAEPAPTEQRILRYDGKAWSAETLPAHAQRMQRLLPGPRGSLWVTLEKSPEVLVRSSSGAWSTIRAPAHLDAIWAGPAGDVWAVAGAKLLHTRPLPRGFDLAAVLPPRSIELWGPSCGSVAVLIHDVPRTAPKNVSFAATIELLRPSLGGLADKVAYYDVTSGGKRSFVVRVDDPESSSDESAREVASANALMKAAEAKIPGAKPRLVCLHVREKGKLPQGVQSMRAVGGTAGQPVSK